MRFAPRIDVIAHKLAPVASGEVGEFLHFSSQNTVGIGNWISKENTDIFAIFTWGGRSEFLSYDIDSRCKTHLLDRNFSKIKILLPPEISTVKIYATEVS